MAKIAAWFVVNVKTTSLVTTRMEPVLTAVLMAGLGTSVLTVSRDSYLSTLFVIKHNQHVFLVTFISIYCRCILMCP